MLPVKVVFFFGINASLANINEIKIGSAWIDNTFHITNKVYQEMFNASKATATRDLTDLVEKFKLVERYGDVAAGTTYKLIGTYLSQLEWDVVKIKIPERNPQIIEIIEKE